MKVGKQNMNSILKDWVMELGIRHQGVLLSAVRGCDTAAKHDWSKLIVRALRSEILNAHCGDAMKASSFLSPLSPVNLNKAFVNLFYNGFDHYPNHYVMHLVHAIEILGYKHPDEDLRYEYNLAYQKFIKKLHLNPETEEQLDIRLNKNEADFAADQ